MPTHYQGSPVAKRALDVYIKLDRAAGAVSSRINAHLADYSLTVSQFGVLEALYHLGHLRQKDLAQKILKSTGNITLVIDNLVKRNLVTRKRDKRDRRAIYIHLTEAGKALIDNIFPKHVAIVEAEMNVLSPAEQDELARLCRKLGLQQA
ncbi:MAG: MarR family transcriptional regulator [Deinococcota bacterium]